MLHTIVALCGALAAAGAAPTETVARVQGDYIEARTADVYTGPCFSNSEVFLTGHQAVMAWKVTEGAWDGVDLSGLSVAAAVRGTTTFSKDDPAKAEAVLIVEKTASPAQRAALVAMAQSLGGERLDHIARVETAMVNLFIEDHDAASAEDAHASHMPAAPHGLLTIPGLAEINTRPLDEGDHFCGNEVVEYAPLSKGVNAQPAFTLAHAFKGAGLGTNWDDPNCRSSFVGHFRY